MLEKWMTAVRQVAVGDTHVRVHFYLRDGSRSHRDFYGPDYAAAKALAEDFCTRWQQIEPAAYYSVM